MRIRDNRSEVKQKAVTFIKDLDKPVFVLGTNKYGLSIVKWLSGKGYQIGGFINDFINEVRFDNYPIVRSIDCSGEYCIVNCIVEGRTIDALSAIEKMNAHSQIDFFALQLAFPDELIEIDFLGETGTINDKKAKYAELYSKFSDEESKLDFEKIVNFRLNRDIQYLRNFRFRLEEQYFEAFVRLGNTPSFIDGGGFDGGTTKLFTKLYPSYKNVYYFEPNESSMTKSMKNLDGIKRINYYQKGLWDKSEKLYFDNSLGSASKLSEIGSSYIETIAIDKVDIEEIDFMKLDIEGAEFNALVGSKETIIRYKPKLAICVYHNQDDFIRIPDLVMSYNPAYKIYLRHYTQGVFETVMYFI